MRGDRFVLSSGTMLKAAPGYMYIIISINIIKIIIVKNNMKK